MNTASGSCELHGDRLARAIRFIERHFNQPLSLEEMAQAAYLSRFHFARLFRVATGESPMARLRRVRIERAIALMTRGDLTLSEIASEVGFCDQSHFTRHFRRVTGTTPGRFLARGSAAVKTTQAPPPCWAHPSQHALA